MAVDNRNFVNKFANEGGGDVLVEDKRMEELKSATAKTSSQISTSANYIPLQDTDGNLVKINPASFEEAVRNVLGGLLANNDKGTTISGLPALSGSGNSLDFGSITPANLASVLGALGISNNGLIKKGQSLVEGTNPNTILESGIYLHGFTLYTGGSYGVLFVLGTGTYIVQVDFNLNAVTIEFRYSLNEGSSWSNWKTIVS